MFPYLTNDRFRHMGVGIDLDGIEEFDLRAILTRASTLVNDYTAAPVLPQRHDFSGGSITGERSTWTDGRTRRVYPAHKPIKAVTLLRLEATPNISVTFNPAEIYIQPGEGWAEVTSFALSNFGLAGNLVLQGYGLQQPVAVIDYTYGYSFTAVDEPLDATDAWTYRAQNGAWDTDVEPVVYRDGTEVNAADYEIDARDGTVTFDDPPAADDAISADYTYTLPTEIAHATGVIAESLLSERELVGKGLGGLDSIKVEEIELRRFGGRRAGGGTGVVSSTIPDAAKALLAGYVFMTVR